MQYKKLQILVYLLFLGGTIQSQCPFTHNGIIEDLSKWNIVSTATTIPISGTNDELSGVTYDFLSDVMVAVSDEQSVTSFTVNNSGLTGTPVNRNFNPSGAGGSECTINVPTQFNDTEAIAHDGRANRFLIAEEREARITVVNFNPLQAGNISFPGSNQSIRLQQNGVNIACNNDGIEAMTVFHDDYNVDYVIVAKQKNKSQVFYFDMPTSFTDQFVEIIPLFDINEIGLPFSIESIHGMTRAGHGLLILASKVDPTITDDGLLPRVIVETDRCGNLLSYIDLEASGVIANTDELEGIIKFPPEDDQVAIGLVGETIGSGSRLIILNKDTDGDGVADINDPNQNNPCVPISCTNFCDETLVDFQNFDGGWGIWNDGGSDARRSSRDRNYANSGRFCARLRDNTNSSVITTDNLNLSAYESLRVEFSYIGRSMDNANEDFWLQISTDGGSSYTSLEEWNKGDEFQNNNREIGVAEFIGPFSSNTKIRMRNDASNNYDWVYIDDVRITGCGSSSAVAETTNNKSLSNETSKKPVAQMSEINIYPNPVSQYLTIETNFSEAQKVTLDLVSASGQLFKREKLIISKGQNTNEMNVTNIPEGMYYIQMYNEVESILKKVSIIH